MGTLERKGIGCVNLSKTGQKVARITPMCTTSYGSPTAIKDAASRLIKGDLVAFPTETVYGLGADATNRNAVARIFEVKGRPSTHPIIVHISSINYLDMWAKDIPDYAADLAQTFWPGPMTLILPRTDIAKDFITGNQDSVGIRIPSNTIAQELLKDFEALGGLGIGAPSANRFGAVSPTTAAAVEIELADFLSSDDKILDGGFCEIGIESTIIDCTKLTPSILRPGSISKEKIEDVLNIYVKMNFNSAAIGQVKAPGLLESHYSPNAKVFLTGSPTPGDGFIALDSFDTPEGALRLASPKNNEEFARLLYEAFRVADKNRLKRIFVIPPIGDGIATAINDRLAKSSYDRISLYGNL
jgi:L-threonylcarbamoyladenylate synthase